MSLLALRHRLHLDTSKKSRGLVFLFVGGLATLGSTGATELIHLAWSWQLWVATIPTAQAAILFKFGVNRSFTWGVKDNPWRRFWAHEGVCLIALAAQTLAVFLAANLLHWPALFALGAGVLAGLGINYLGNEFGVFKVHLPHLELLPPAYIEKEI